MSTPRSIRSLSSSFCVALSTAALLMLMGTSSLARDPVGPSERSSQIEIVFRPASPAAPDALAKLFVRDWRRALQTGGVSTVLPSLVGQRRPLRVEHAFNEYVSRQSEAAPQGDRFNSALARYVIMTFPEHTDTAPILAVIRREQSVQSAGEAPSLSPPNDPLAGGPDPIKNEERNQWGLFRQRMHDAWDWTTGGSIVTLLDIGIQVDHPDLIAFDTSGFYVGGNTSPWMSRDLGLSDSNVDENREQAIVGDPDCPNAVYTPNFVGHGTHVAGLVGATTNNGVGIAGICPSCSLLVAKASRLVCDTPTFIRPSISYALAVSGMEYSASRGTQVVSMSFGENGGGMYCDNNPPEGIRTFCTAIELLAARDIIMVAASGNENILVNFPAREKEIVAVGGVKVPSSGSELLFWEAGDGQPAGPGSNFSDNPPVFWRQELTAPAKNVLSTFYTNRLWNNSCADDLTNFPDEHAGPGYGYCTGTSMSAPHVAGLFGVLRALNPLMPAGSPDGPSPTADGLRSVVAFTTRQAQLNQQFDSKLGWGVPDANAAVHRMLGTIGGGTPKNRVTPLFSLYGTTAQDFAFTTAPQVATALIAGAGSYNSTTTHGVAIPAYPDFPHEASLVPLAPRASMYILSGSWSPLTGVNLVPLWRLNAPHQDNAYATTAAQLESLKAAGYAIEKREGYLFQRCSTPDSEACKPFGTKRVVQIFSPSRNDHAIVFSDEMAAFAGYGSPVTLGFAYAPADTDEGVGDGIVDGFEYVLGLDPFDRDSDCDGIVDGVEWPLVYAPTSDPRVGPCAPSVDLSFSSTYQSMRAQNLSTIGAPAVEFRISVGASGYGFMSNPVVSGPGTCQAIPSEPNPGGGEIGVYYSWICQTSLAPSAIQDWQVIFEACDASNGWRTIELMSSTPIDSNNANNSATYYGNPCTI